MAMCAKCEAVEARREAAGSLLAACQRFGIGEGLKAIYPPDPELPANWWDLLKKL